MTDRPLVLLDPYRAESAAEIGLPCGQLLTPLTGYARLPGVPWAIDNGGFAKADPQAFLARLDRERRRAAEDAAFAEPACLWVAAPDVPGSARRTLELLDAWYPRLNGWPIALVAQDGLEDLAVPWYLIRALFIGGSDRWKESAHAAALVRAAQWLSIWVHMGRVNTPRRLAIAIRWGVDSIDGTGLSRYTWMREAAAEAALDERPLLGAQSPS